MWQRLLWIFDLTSLIRIEYRFDIWIIAKILSLEWILPDEINSWKQRKCCAKWTVFPLKILQSFGVNWCESGLREDRTSGHLPRLGSRFSPDSRASRDYFVGSASALFSFTSTMNNSTQQKYLHLDINFSKSFHRIYILYI